MKVLFFARLREACGAPSLTLPEGVEPADVIGLRQWLIDTQSDALGAALMDPNVFCAVNQRVVADDATLEQGDEVAFFPPVTGG